MRINNNLMAMNTHRMLGINTTAGAASVEKLSSGYRINRAGDDAAGLAISEKMRSQIRGLSQASRNALDDISLIQTAEGALNETHAIIHRMREMAVQSSNDSNTDPDREAIQNEMDQLAAEITRIANDTEFNTRKLLNGNLDSSVQNATGNLTFHIGANTNQNMKFAVKAMDAFTLGLARSGAKIESGRPDIAKVSVEGLATEWGNGLKATTVKVTSSQTQAPVPAKAWQVKLNGAVDTTTNATSGINATLNVVVDGKSYNIDFNDFKYGAGAYTANDVKNYINDKAGLEIASVDGTNTINFKNAQVGQANEIVAPTISGAAGNDLAKILANQATAGAIGKVDVQTGANYVPGKYDVTVTGSVNGVDVNETVNVDGNAGAIVFTADFKGLIIETDGLFEGISGELSMRLSNAATFTGAGATIAARAELGIDVTTQQAANTAIDRIDKALKRVSDQRAELGAVQNRLGHTIKNVDTAAENLQASESRIRDVDMAKEMMNYTKNNILQQAAQAMLAQANQAPQGVLQLLR